jgi:hypothetical protein
MGPSGAPSNGGHLDLDTLADVLAGAPEPAHLASCLACRARLDDLGDALPRVSEALAAAPVPQMPLDLPERIAAHLHGAPELQADDEEQAVAPPVAPPGTADVLPMARRRVRWLPSVTAVAAAAVLITSAVLLTQRHHEQPGTASAASGGGYAVNDSGANYTRTTLQAALPALLKGQANAPRVAAAPAGGARPAPGFDSTQPKSAGALTFTTAGDPLAALRTTTGLARCLASLTDPGDTGLPLALDYASFQGRPALVVVLPSKVAGKVDVFVVPPGCARADGNLLYFTRLPKP